MLTLTLTALLLLGAQPLSYGVAAHQDWWLQGLPQCWQGCFSDTEQARCQSSKCICETSRDSALYLPAAVSCAISECDAAEWTLDLVLGPLGLYCAAIQRPIPDQVMADAHAAADGDDEEEEQPQPTTNPPATRSKSSSPQKTTRPADVPQDLTGTIRSTFTRTTTENGHTLQVVVPIVIGPSGMFTGSASTSTMTGRVSSTAAAQSSVAASPRPSGSGPWQPWLQPMVPTSTPSSQSTQRPASGNGSPFENMQAGATRWSVSAPVLGLGVVAVVFARL